jgi:hypothetical protein
MLKRLHEIYLRALASWHPPEPDPSGDPYAGVRQPRLGGSPRRTSAIALDEPPLDHDVHALGRPIRDR